MRMGHLVVLCGQNAERYNSAVVVLKLRDLHLPHQGICSGYASAARHQIFAVFDIMLCHNNTEFQCWP